MSSPSPVPRPKPPVRRAGNPRAYPLVLRVTAAERDEIRVAADRHAVTISDYLRSRCMDYPLPLAKSPMSARAFRVLSGLANNLNQLVRQVHEGWIRDTSHLVPVVEHLRTEIEVLRGQIAEGLEAPEEETGSIAEEALAARRRGGRPQADPIEGARRILDLVEEARRKGGGA